MVGQAILHVANMAVIVVEDLRISLTRAAVVDHDKLPLRISPIRRRPIDLCPNRACQVTIARAASAPAAAMKKAVPKAGTLFRAGFLDRKLRRFFS